jgi:hypothetical protein
MATATPPAHDQALVPDDESLFAELSGDAFRDTPLWMVSDVVSTVLDLYGGGRVTAEEAERALASLVVVDTSGTKWALGATTRRWFRKDIGGAWVLAKAPTDPQALVAPAAEAVKAGLWALGVDPSTVDIGDSINSAPTVTRESAEDLLDDLIEEYGD